MEPSVRKNMIWKRLRFAIHIVTHQGRSPCSDQTVDQYRVCQDSLLSVVAQHILDNVQEGLKAVVVQLQMDQDSAKEY